MAFNQNIGHWIAWWGEVSKEREMLVFNDRRIKYREFNQKVNRVANSLIENFGIRKGDRVAVLLNNSVEFLEIVFACSKIGARFVPLNVRLAGREISFIINDTTPQIIYTQSSFARLFSEIENDISVKNIINVEGSEYKYLASLASDAEPANQATWDDDFAILYTSGTTGLPKGALVSQRNVRECTYNMMTVEGYTDKERIYINLPLCFIGSLVPLTMPVIHSGGTIVLDHEFDPQVTLKMIEQEKITFLRGVPTVFISLAKHSAFDSTDFTSVKRIVVGSAPVPISLIELYRNKGVMFVSGYGLTEGTGYNMMSMDEDKMNGLYPLIGNEVKVVNEQGQPVEPGEIGELLIKGPTVFGGYWNNPEATAETIKDGWLHTGDMFKIDEDGSYFIVDRKKNMIISGGLNIYCSEVENVLYSHPAVSEVSVIGVPHDHWGEAVVAVVIPKENQLIEERAVIKYCRERLADYKSPKAVIFVDSLPFNAGGKVVKRKLTEQYQDLFVKQVK